MKLSQYREPKSDLGNIGDDNYENYLVDDVEDSMDQADPGGVYTDEATEQPGGFLDEIPTSTRKPEIPQQAKEVPYTNSLNLVYDGIDTNELISFDYTNRHGTYAGTRTVEPHYTFIAASTGNEILVTFDRDVNDIRAFIVSNIHPNGVRHEGVKFTDRPEIMRGII